MLDFTSYNIKIESAFSLSWDAKSAYARPRNYDALSFRISGDANYEHGDQKYHVLKNDILFVPAHYDYQLIANKHEEVFVVHFFIENSNFQELQIFKPLNPDAFLRLFSEMANISRTQPIGYKAKLLSLFYKICEELAIQSYNNALLLTPPKLEIALQYLHKNFTNPETTVEKIAEHIKTSTVYLRRLFHSSLNTTPLKYLNDLRMNYAIDLLKTGYYNIEEIATKSGFYDPKYFSSLYKKKTGFSPSKKMKPALSHNRFSK